ncbi:hypothetical protein [Bradyrhizobium lablabi]|uniref:hypothetical protein n=1 Tax=Bradyrhizobium lablabi TaxID=722472 RepID=UPI0012AB37E8|nr:hypothetical protein [Bradyrhizobium lablabi]
MAALLSEQPIRFVRFLVDLLKCEAMVREVLLEAEPSEHDLMLKIVLKTMTVSKAATREIAASSQ